MTTYGRPVELRFDTSSGSNKNWKDWRRGSPVEGKKSPVDREEEKEVRVLVGGSWKLW